MNSQRGTLCSKKVGIDVRSRMKVTTFNSILVCLLCVLYVWSNMYIVRNKPFLTFACDVLDMGTMVILIAMVLISNFHTKMFAGMCILTAYMVVCYLYTGMFDLLRATVILLALKDASAHKTYRMLFRTFVMAITVVFVLFLLGISNTGATTRDAITLGFATTNVASKMLQSAVFVWVLWKPNVPVKRRITVCLLTAALIWGTTGSRNSALLLLILPICLRFVKKIMSSKHAWVIKYLFFAAPLLFMGLTVLLSQLHGKYAWVQVLNGLLSNRIFMNGVAIQHYGSSLIGQAANIKDFSGVFDPVAGKYTTFLTIDSFYVYALSYYGILGAAITLLTMTAVIRRAWQQNNAEVVTVSLLVCVYGMAETMTTVFCMPALIYLFLRDDTAVESKTGVQKYEINYI